MNHPNASFFFGLRTSRWYPTTTIRNNDFLRAMSVDAARNGVIAGNYVYNAVVDAERGVMAVLRQPLPGTNNSASIALCRIDMSNIETGWNGASAFTLGA